MFKLNGFRLLGLAAVLIALLATVGGLVISQWDQQSAVSDQELADSSHRAEVFNLSGKRLFDSGPTMGNTLDWAMTTEGGERVAHGVYLPSAQFF